jgi:hypothetical protein
VIVSLFFTISKREIKCRFYEDDDETSIIDLNNAINRKRYRYVEAKDK